METKKTVIITKLNRGPQRVGLTKMYPSKQIPLTDQDSDSQEKESNDESLSTSEANDSSEKSKEITEKTTDMAEQSNNVDINDTKSFDFLLSCSSDSNDVDQDTSMENNASLDKTVASESSEDSNDFTGFHVDFLPEIKPLITDNDMYKFIVKIEKVLFTEEVGMPSISTSYMKGELATDVTIKKEILENSDKENSFQENTSSDQGDNNNTSDRPAGKRKRSDNGDTSFDNMKLLSQVSSGVTDSKDEGLVTSTMNTPTVKRITALSSRLSGTESPSMSGGRRSIKRVSTTDLSNPAFRKPFEFGWKRELVYRNSTDSSSKVQADVYYYTPKNKKIRSNREVADHLHGTELTTENFTFFKDSLNLDDPTKEVIRSAAQRSTIGGEFVPPVKKTPAKKKEAPKPKETPSPREPRTPKPALLPSPGSVTGPRASTTPGKRVFPRIKGAKAVKVTSPSSKAKKPVDKDGDMEMGTLPPGWNAPSNKPATSPTPKRKAADVDQATTAPAKRAKTDEEYEGSEFMKNFASNLSKGYSVFLQVFQYLKTQELLRAARVCKMWRDLASHRSLWRTVRLKNSHVEDWQGLAQAMCRHETQHLDLRKMLLPSDPADNEKMWREFSAHISKARTLTRIDLCRCPPFAVEDIALECPQLVALNAVTIKCSILNLASFGNLANLVELRLKSMTGAHLERDLKPIKELIHLKNLAMTTFKDIGQAGCENFKYLTNLETFELGECVDLPENFGQDVLMKMTKLQRLRLEKGQGKTCFTFKLLDAIKDLPQLSQLELINYDVKIGFESALAQCTNIRRLLLIPTYVTQSATTNYVVFEGVTKLNATLSHFVWGVTQELLRVTELFVDQCDSNASKLPVKSKDTKKDTPSKKLYESIPILKPGSLDRTENLENLSKEELKDGKTNAGQVEIQTLHKLQKQLVAALPNTKIKIVKIPFHATWKQTIADPPHH